MMRRPDGPGRRRARLLEVAVGHLSWVMWFDPWRGVSWPVQRPTVDRSWLDVWKEFHLEVDAMKCPQPRTAPSAVVERQEVPDMLKKAKHLAEVLVQPAWEDDVPKGGRALMLFIDPAKGYQLIIKVANPPLKLTLGGRSWDEVFAAAELCLRGEDIPWALDERPVGAPVKKRK